MSDDEEFVRHLESLGVPLSAEQRKVGLDRNTEEGALLAFSGSLRGTNPRHRLIAWVLLVSFGFPGLLMLIWLGREGLHWIWAQAS